jgi:hypothetical protein
MDNEFLLQLMAILTFLTNLVAVFASLGGISALIAALVNAGKTVGIVKDGDAGKWSMALNALAFVGVAVLGLFAKVSPDQFDAAARTLVGALVPLFGLLFQLIASAKVHNDLASAGIPVIGKSYSLEEYRSSVGMLTMEQHTARPTEE